MGPSLSISQHTFPFAKVLATGALCTLGPLSPLGPVCPERSGAVPPEGVLGPGPPRGHTVPQPPRLGIELCCIAVELVALNKVAFFSTPQLWDSCWWSPAIG